MDDKVYLGIDYGGNAVKMGLVSSTGQMVGHASRPTVDLLDEASCRAFAADIAEFVRASAFDCAELGGVGLAIPGIAVAGSYSTPNVKADWPLVLDSLGDALGTRSVAVANDANAAALGELWMGAGGGVGTALLVAIGSGLGAGLVVDGRIVAGGHGAAGELGHLTVVPGGRPCMCGREGCVERYASARGLVLSFLEASGTGDDAAQFCDIAPKDATDALSVYRAAKQGDPRGQRAFAIMADKLGFALAQMACVVDPDVILLGGGLTAAADLYLDALREAYRAYAFGACKVTEIRLSTLLGNAGVIGSARYAMQTAACGRPARG